MSVWQGIGKIYKNKNFRVCPETGDVTRRKTPIHLYQKRTLEDRRRSETPLPRELHSQSFVVKVIDLLASLPLWTVVLLSTSFVAAVAGGAYGAYLHPAWRRQRQVKRACRVAFPDGKYTLVRFHLSPNAPSGLDLFSGVWSGRSAPRRYFTYRIETEQSPDLSGLSRSEQDLVRHYMNRPNVPPHYGREVLVGAEGRPPPQRSPEAAA